MNQIDEFRTLNPETQFIFLSNSIKIQDQNIFKRVVIHPTKTEVLYYSNSMKLQSFYIFLSFYKNILIEIRYPSQNFNLLFELMSRIRDKFSLKMNIGVVISSFPDDI